MKGILKFLSGFSKPKIDSNGDIKILPRQNGVLIFPISMAKISGELSATNLFAILENQIHSKWNNYPLSIIFLYTGDVYSKYGLGSNSSYNYDIKKHKEDCMRIINYSTYLTKDAFSFVDWDELFNSDKIISEKFEELKSIYLSDEIFQKLMYSDLKRLGKTVDTNNINFLLEEMILPYLFVKGGFDFTDKFTNNTNRYKLICYSGNCPKILVYIHQMNFFNLDKTTNVYQNCFYNFKSNFLFNFEEINLESVLDLSQFIVDFRKKD
jgi:hypothetical protein